MPPTERRVNQRYCKLLIKTFEKYKGINLVQSQIRAVDEGKQKMLNIGKKVSPDPEEHNLESKIKKKAGTYKVKTDFYTKKKFLKRKMSSF